MNIQFHVTSAVIVVLAAAISGLLTQLATQNPSDSTAIMAIVAAIGAGVQKYETLPSTSNS